MNNRNYSLDAMRAIMMLLGLVVHVTISYTTLDVFPHFLGEAKPHVAYDYTVLFIHAFRMPVFFVLAGFFATLLYAKRGNKSMILNRLYRIVFPFIVAFILIAPLNKLLFKHYAMEVPWNELLDSVKNLTVYINLRMAHLWFLYYLILIYAIVHFFRLIKIPFLSGLFDSCKQIIFQNPKRAWITILVFTCLNFASIFPQGTGMIDTPVDFTPDIYILATYLIYFLFGYMLFAYSSSLQEIFSTWKIWLVAGLLLSVAYYFSFVYTLDHPGFYNMALTSFISSLLSWVLIFGFMGLFLTYFSKESKTLSLIGRSSYWVYLAHLPLTIVLGAFLAKYQLPSLVNCLIVIALTYLILIVLYKLIVEGSFIGRFLNGKSK